MTLKDLISDEEYEQLLINGLPENSESDPYPVVYLGSPIYRRRWLISKIHPEDHSQVYALYDMPTAGNIKAGFINIDEVLAIEGGIKQLPFEGEMPMSVYQFAAETERYITDDYNHLCDAQDSMDIERLYDALGVCN